DPPRRGQGRRKLRVFQAVAKWRAGFRVSLVRTPALPGSRREEVGSLARVYARFAPNFGEDPKHGESARLPRPTRAGTQWPVGNGSTRAETGRVQARRPPFVEFRDSLPENEKSPNLRTHRGSAGYPSGPCRVLRRRRRSGPGWPNSARG